jgi:hypothetical protein
VCGSGHHERGNTILEGRVVHCRRKRGLDMGVGRRKSRPAAGANPGRGAPTALQVSIGARSRHQESGAGAALALSSWI